jgi:hypothetical protein
VRDSGCRAQPVERGQHLDQKPGDVDSRHRIVVARAVGGLRRSLSRSPLTNGAIAMRFAGLLSRSIVRGATMRPSLWEARRANVSRRERS